MKLFPNEPNVANGEGGGALPSVHPRMSDFIFLNKIFPNKPNHPGSDDIKPHANSTKEFFAS